MRAFKHPTNNAVLGAPSNWDVAVDGECIDLPISRAHGAMFSYWRPSWRERLSIFFGGHVRLGVFGHSHPPVAIDTFS